MPRTISGLDGGTRIPLRGLTKLLKNLPAAARDRLESAFVDAENLLDYYDRSVRDKQNKRKISGLIDEPILVVSQSILGASVKFERLNDPRISFYEIQVDDTNTFPDPEVFQVVDPFFAIDGISSIKFIRARGVRGVTGETGNWSATVRATPTLTAPAAYSCQFYQRYSGSEPNLFRKRSYGGEDTPGFYTLLDCTFYGSRQVGGMSLWGMISNRLKKPLNSNVRPWDRLKWTINGLTRMENYFPLWTDTFGNPDTPMVNPSTGANMSFYALGGYTASFGPYNLDVPVTERGQGPMDPRAFDDIDAPGCGFYWAKEPLIARPSRLDTGQLDAFDDFINTGREALTGIATNASTSYLVAQNFGFKIPADEDIRGIEVKVKRRQLKYPAVPRELLPFKNSQFHSVTNGVQFDYGYDPIKRVLENNYNQASPFSPAVSLQDILKDVDYGKFVELAGDTGAGSATDVLSTSGRIALGSLGIEPVTDFNTFIRDQPWTVSLWANPYLSSISASEELFTYQSFDAASSGSSNIQFFRLNSGNDQTLQLSSSGTGGVRTQLYTNRISSTNAWYHFVITYAGLGATAFNLFINGVLATPSSASGSFTGFAELDKTFGGYVGLATGLFTLGRGSITGGKGQTGLWNKVLAIREIQELFRMRMLNDYRYNQGSYESANNLQHYWLYLPEEPQISDMEIRLVDSDGIRTDLDNKAEDTELWPKLDDFFYQISFSPEGQLLASSSGIPHDNVIGIGYQTYGGPLDMWGADSSDITKTKVADRRFGVAVRAKNALRAFPGVAYVDHVKMTIYTSKPGDNSINVKVLAESANQFYTEREVFGGLFNAIETGEFFGE